MGRYSRKVCPKPHYDAILFYFQQKLQQHSKFHDPNATLPKVIYSAVFDHVHTPDSLYILSLFDLIHINIVQFVKIVRNYLLFRVVLICFESGKMHQDTKYILSDKTVKLYFGHQYLMSCNL